MQTIPLTDAPEVVDLKAWQFLGRDGRAYACSWCQREQGVAATSGDGSHGICPTHFERELATIQKALTIEEKLDIATDELRVTLDFLENYDPDLREFHANSLRGVIKKMENVE